MVVMKNFNLVAMKKLFSFVLMAAMIAAVSVSCNKVEEVVDPSEDPTTVGDPKGPETLVFALGNGEATKAILADDGGKKYGSWETGDRLGSITTKSAGSSTINASESPVTFAIYSKGGLEVGNTINVWYPYGEKQTDATAIPLSIPSEQYQGVSTFDFDIMPMVAETVTVTAGMIGEGNDTTPVGSIDMLNLGSLLNFKIFSTNATYVSERVVSVNLTTTTGIVGDFTIDLTAVDASDDDTMLMTGIAGTSVTTTLAGPSAIGADKEHALDVYMVVAPGTYSGTVTVTTDKASYTYALSDKSWARSSMKSFGLDLKTAAAKSNRTVLTKGTFSWALNEVTYSSATADAVTWPHALVTMSTEKTGSTPANNSLPPANTSETRFYSGNKLSFDVEGTRVDKVIITATTSGYASTLAGLSWTNAKAIADDVNVTITPTDPEADFYVTLSGAFRASKAQVFFDETSYTISSVNNPAAGGSFTVKDGDDVVTSAKVNTLITLAATPNSGYVFNEWTVKDSENNTITVTDNTFRMPAKNVTVTANYVVAGADPSITIAPYSNGTVNTSPSGTATPGTKVTITATPNSGYLLTSLVVKDATDANVAVDANNQFTMPTSDVTITVTFERGYVLSKADACLGTSTTGTSYVTSEKSFTADDGSAWKLKGYRIIKDDCLIIGTGGANYLTTPSCSASIKKIIVWDKGNTSYYLTVKTSDSSATELIAYQHESNSAYTKHTFDLTSYSYTQLRLVGRRATGTSNAAANLSKVMVIY